MRHLSPRTIEVLKVIAKRPSERSKIAEKLKLPTSVLNSILSRLEKSDHVRRALSNNPAYFNKAVFSITESGRKMIKLGSGSVKDKPLPHIGVYSKASPSSPFTSSISDMRNVMQRDVYRPGDGEDIFYQSY